MYAANISALRLTLKSSSVNAIIIGSNSYDSYAITKLSRVAILQIILIIYVFLILFVLTSGFSCFQFYILNNLLITLTMLTFNHYPIIYLLVILLQLR